MWSNIVGPTLLLSRTKNNLIRYCSIMISKWFWRKTIKNGIFRCGVWEMIWNTWLRLSSGMARWVEFETNFWQILWLMFQVAEAGVLAWGDLITLGRLDDLENQIIVLCLQEIGWCNSRGEISSTGMCILCRQKIFSMKYTDVFIYPCRPQTSPACWFTLPGPLANPRGWWCHRFLSNFHSETLLVEWRFFFMLLCRTISPGLWGRHKRPMTGTGTQKRWNNYIWFQKKKEMKMNWTNIYKESFSSIKALEMILFTQGVTYLPLSHVAAQVLSIFKIKIKSKSNMEVYLFTWSVFKTWFQGEAMSFDLCR